MHCACAGKTSYLEVDVRHIPVHVTQAKRAQSQTPGINQTFSQHHNTLELTRVPLAKAGISNTPMGPFHTTVWASPMASCDWHRNRQANELRTVVDVKAGYQIPSILHLISDKPDTLCSSHTHTWKTFRESGPMSRPIQPSVMSLMLTTCGQISERAMSFRIQNQSFFAGRQAGRQAARQAGSTEHVSGQEVKTTLEALLCEGQLVVDVSEEFKCS